MKGAISYLRKLREICKEHKGDCRRCPLGEQEKLEDTLCPRLTSPRSWDDGKTTAMVKII